MCFPWHVGFDGKVNTRDAENLPFLYWPDERPCFDANIYMMSLLKKGLSRKNRGGTIAEYAKKISPLIRFCYKNRIKFLDINDNYFTLFIQGLSVLSVDGRKKRSSNEVIKIGTKCIDFLMYLSEFYRVDGFIGSENCSVTIIRNEFIKSIRSKKNKKIEYWSHESFPDPDPTKRRQPISNDAVKALKNEAQKITDQGLRLRAELMIACFEQTGARRAEVSNITVANVEAASHSSGSAPMLLISTVKGGNDREIPVPRVFIQLAMKYIKRVRRRVISSKLGRSNDHGVLLVSHTTGHALSIDTLTTYVSNLVKSAGIEEHAHPHLFRHAYITQKFIATILLHDLNNKDDFRRALLSTSAIKLDIQQWTGHKSLDSLDTYIDLAFYEISEMNKIHNDITLTSAVNLASDRLDSLKLDASEGRAKLPELIQDLEDIIESLKLDINMA